MKRNQKESTIEVEDSTIFDASSSGVQVGSKTVEGSEIGNISLKISLSEHSSEHSNDTNSGNSTSHNSPKIISTTHICGACYRETYLKIIEKLEEFDWQQYFHFPVTDLIAPGYTQKIKFPMDLSTMKTKVKQFCYSSPKDFRYDFEIFFILLKST